MKDYLSKDMIINESVNPTDKWLLYGYNNNLFNPLFHELIISYLNNNDKNILLILKKMYIKIRNNLNRHLPVWDLSILQVANNILNEINDIDDDKYHNVRIWLSISLKIIYLLQGCLSVLSIFKYLESFENIKYLQLLSDMNDIIDISFIDNLSFQFDTEKELWYFQKIPWNCMECGPWRTPYHTEWIWGSIDKRASELQAPIVNSISRICSENDIVYVLSTYISKLTATCELLLKQFETFLIVKPKWATRETIGDIILLTSELYTRSLEWTYLITSIDKRIGGCRKINKSEYIGLRWQVDDIYNNMK